ncbi:MAG: helix-turn-helix transcriptional regulator [Oscillospiraceae bacterium]|nr:helix-turn-helix transcriptional regulator [Oscillospiraceae bacterium]
MHYYQRLRDLREDRDMTQAEIAAVLKTTRQQYALYEMGDREIPFHHAITLAKLYCVSLDYIAGRTNKTSRG